MSAAVQYFRGYRLLPVLGALTPALQERICAFWLQEGALPMESGPAVKSSGVQACREHSAHNGLFGLMRPYRAKGWNFSVQPLCFIFASREWEVSRTARRAGELVSRLALAVLVVNVVNGSNPVRAVGKPALPRERRLVFLVGLRMKQRGLAVNKHPSLDAGLKAYSVTARTVLNLKKPAKRLGELTLYTAAAGSALALAPAAEAAIIYSGIQNITANRVGTTYRSVDLNGDGQLDMAFSISSPAGGGSQYDLARVSGYPIPGYGSALFFNNKNYSLLRLAASSRTIDANIGPNTALNYFATLRLHGVYPGGTFLAGLWNPGPNAATTGFAGVAISPNDPAANQFGWLHFKLTTDGANRAASLTLIDSAFESVPGKAIHVGDKGTSSIPEPSTLGLLALGAAGLALLRRRRDHEKNADAVH